MSINLNAERSIMKEILRYLPTIAARDGQVVIRSSRGILTITAGNDRNISYSYNPSSNQDIPTSETGSISSLTDRIVDLAVYLLDTYGGKIGYTSENIADYVKNGTSKFNNGLSTPVKIRNSIDLTKSTSSSGFKDSVTNGYGSYEREDIVGSRYSFNGRRDLNGGVQGVAIPNRISRTNTVDTGYSLSGGNTGDLLTSNTYDGGNEILTGGMSGYRSNYGSNRLPGTAYGEYQYSMPDTDVQDIRDTPETYLTGGRDLLGGYADNMYGGNDDDIDNLGGYTDVNARMEALSNNGYNANAGGINAVNVSDPAKVLSLGDRGSTSRSSAGVLGIGNATGESIYSPRRNYTGNQVRFVNATNRTNVSIGGVPDTYNNAASDLGIGYGDLTAHGMTSTRRGSIGGNNITRNANLGIPEPPR